MTPERVLDSARGMEKKTCSRCAAAKPVGEFYAGRADCKTWYEQVEIAAYQRGVRDGRGAGWHAAVEHYFGAGGNPGAVTRASEARE